MAADDEDHTIEALDALHAAAAERQEDDAPEEPKRPRREWPSLAAGMVCLLLAAGLVGDAGHASVENAAALYGSLLLFMFGVMGIVIWTNRERGAA